MRFIALIATAALMTTGPVEEAHATRIATAVSMEGKSGFDVPPDDAVMSYFTTANGCTYRRAQAPGYAPTWHLVQNPHHIGKPSAHKGCPGSLRN